MSFQAKVGSFTPGIIIWTTKYLFSIFDLISHIQVSSKVSVFSKRCISHLRAFFMDEDGSNPLAGISFFNWSYFCTLFYHLKP